MNFLSPNLLRPSVSVSRSQVLPTVPCWLFGLNSANSAWQRSYGSDRVRGSTQRNGSKMQEMVDHKCRCHYEVLGVWPGVPAAQLKEAFHRLCMATHPDRHPMDPNAAARFKRVCEAYAVLKDPVLRSVYNRENVHAKRDHGPQMRNRSTRRVMNYKVPFDFDAFYQGHYGDPSSQRPRRSARSTPAPSSSNSPSIAVLLMLFFAVTVAIGGIKLM
uniref:dnaJ homolog subfamily C member 30, mitochondrial-like isoform X1 n=2 Tax=Myxine glutinosa TaxID=7769 RepID=UPI00358EC057